MMFLLCCIAGAGITLLVLKPLFDKTADWQMADPTDESCNEEKERLYETIRELDFDYRAGKVSDEDYRVLRARYMGHAASLLELRCGRCDEVNPNGSRFCLQCGERVPPVDETPRCTSCDIHLPANAQVCSSCGLKVA